MLHFCPMKFISNNDHCVLHISFHRYTFQKVQDNSEMIWKFNMYALIHEYYDKPMFPIPILLHLLRVIVFCYYKLGYLYESDFGKLCFL